MDEFDIYIRSFRSGGPERPDQALRRVFGLDEEQAREFVASLPRVVKRRVPATDRGRYAQVLGEMGAELEFRRSPIQPIQAVAVKGLGTGQAAAPQPRQPGHILTLGEPLPEPGPGPSASRPPPVWPLLSEAEAASLAPVPRAAPPAAAESVQPAAVSVQAHEPAHSSYELGIAHTHRVEAAAAPRSEGGDPPRQAAPATAVEPRRSWTVANTPAVGASTGEAFAANPVKGPATATLRQQPAFGAAPAPAAVPAAPVRGQAPPAPAAPEPHSSATRRELEVRHASPAIASAEAASLAAGWQDPVPATAPARPASPLLAKPSAPVDAAHAYSQASTSDSMKLDLFEAPKQPSWLVQESSFRQQVASAAPPKAALDVLDSSEPAGQREGGLRAALTSEAYEGDPAASRWLSAVGGEASARGAPRPATPMRAAAAKPQPGPRPEPAGSAPIPIADLPSRAAGPRIDAGRAPARPAGIAARPQRRTLSRALGMESASLPFGVRLLLRVGLGVSGFLLLLTFRSCPLLKTDMEKELAQFEQGDEGDPAAATELSVMQGEEAQTWIETGNHQFRDPSSGDVLVDKDPVRGLINRLHRIGARQVYVYGVKQVDLIVYAEGIDVVLPVDESQRGAIFLEESRFHRLDAPSEPDTGQARLRIRVP